ncbi:glutathione S-transferase family protein [Atopobacter phocae]|uniref:glutathione S-transferase family protein n=1 Tax=Atopobacter phocae TaxID=136492 RepID=UPI000471E8CE|nr:glutathione binding-like protein [Atopobacter phocae]
MKLFYAPGTCALACWIAFEWAGADDYTVEKVVLGSKELYEVNPLGMVPAIKFENDEILTQAGAILNFIAQKYPSHNLGADEDIMDIFKFNEIMDFLSADFHPAFWPMFSPNRFTTEDSKEAQDAVVEAAFKRIDIAMNHLDHLIGDTNHVYKDKRTVADAYAYVMALWSKMTPKSYTEYPNLARFMESMKEDSTVQQVIAASKQ